MKQWCRIAALLILNYTTTTTTTHAFPHVTSTFVHKTPTLQTRSNHQFYNNALYNNKKKHYYYQSPLLSMMALGDYTIELTQPLGIVLQDRNDKSGKGGVKVAQIVNDGSAFAHNNKNNSIKIVPGDVLIQIDDTNVSTFNFDSVTSLLSSSSNNKKVKLTLGDGLGQLNMPPNVIRQLKSTPDAYFIDAVVRQAVREIRNDGRLGDLLFVEVIIGAGVQSNNEESVGKVRFFAIFSTDGGSSTYSCNVSATGVRSINNQKKGNDDENDEDCVRITSLSCAKDEGLGRTFDLI